MFVAVYWWRVRADLDSVAPLAERLRLNGYSTDALENLA
jgi:hypothetical protein